MIWPGVSMIPTVGHYVPDLDEASDPPVLTYMQPYGSAMFHGKTHENRSWAVPQRFAGKARWICVHAGLGWYEGADTAIRRWRALPGEDHRAADYRAWPTAPLTRDAYPRACILGFVRLVGCYELEKVRAIAEGRTLASSSLRAEAQRTIRDGAAWAFGPIVWRTDKTSLLLPKPIPIPRGALGLWSLDDRRAKMPPALQDEVRRALLSCLRDRSTWRTAA